MSKNYIQQELNFVGDTAYTTYFAIINDKRVEVQHSYKPSFKDVTYDTWEEAEQAYKASDLKDFDMTAVIHPVDESFVEVNGEKFQVQHDYKPGFKDVIYDTWEEAEQVYKVSDLKDFDVTAVVHPVDVQYVMVSDNVSAGE